jgi:hypothetical protein
MQDATPPDHASPLSAGDALPGTENISRRQLEFVSLDLN